MNDNKRQQYQSATFDSNASHNTAASDNNETHADRRRNRGLKRIDHIDDNQWVDPPQKDTRTPACPWSSSKYKKPYKLLQHISSWSQHLFAERSKKAAPSHFVTSSDCFNSSKSLSEVNHTLVTLNILEALIWWALFGRRFSGWKYILIRNVNMALIIFSQPINKFKVNLWKLSLRERQNLLTCTTQLV